MYEVIKCFTLLLIYIYGVRGQSDLKSSLVFIIDTTGSMSDDISAVKKQVNAIFDIVTNSNTSQVEDFVLVEFNDPEVKFHTKTKNREEFKRELNSLRVYGGGDCPEMALGGIHTGLVESSKGSELYVFTDAYAKDENKYEAVKNLATDRGCKITFIVSEDSCTRQPHSPVYENLAEATGGQVFPLQKNKVEEILNYVKENIKSRKNLIAQKKFNSGNYKFNYTVDSNLKELVVSVTGNNLKVEITDPYGDIAETEELVKTPKITIVKVVETKPGVYTAEVCSDAPGSMNVYGTSTVHFEHGFSRLPPTAIQETTLRPYPDEQSYLSVKVNVEGGDIQLQSIELYDLNDNLLEEKLLDLVNNDDQFYATREAFVPPNKSFRIAIKGVDLATKAIITRFGLTPIEPQERTKEVVADKAPNITVVGTAEVHVEYEQSVELKCRVSGYPKPEVTWEDETGTKIYSEETQIEIPYDYVSVIEIKSVDANKTIVCKASNSLGEDKKVIEVLTRRTRFFDILETPKDATIEYGNKAKFICKVDSEPEKANIRWYRENKRIRADRIYDISSDGSILIINSMTPELDGNFKCIASNNLYKKGFRFHVNTSGIEKPEIQKKNNEIHVGLRSSANIECKIIKGAPHPEIKWYFKPAYSNKIQRVKGDEKIFMDRVTVRNAGTYSCKVENVAGYDVHFVDLIVEYAPRIVNANKRVVRAVDGQQVKLPCSVVAEPRAEVSWYYNGRLVNDKPFRRYANNDLSFQANTNLTGEYRCEAINKLGIARSKISVFIVVPVTIDKPEESTHEKAVGEDLVLTCNASGHPKPKVQWVYNSMDFLTPSKHLSSSDPNGSLFLKRLQVDQEGHYTCIASNSGSSANFTHTVNILAPPVIINEYPGQTLKAVVGDLVLRITCKTVGSPKPTITWEKDGFNIAAGTDWYDIEDGTLLVKYADKAAEGFYTCKAENRIGSDVETYHVLIEDFPNPGVISKPIVLEEGQSTQIPCPVPHEGVDLLRWYKDNKQIANGALHLTNVNSTDDGIYTCRVSNFVKSNSASILVQVGYKPKFVYSPETEIEFAEGNYAELDCSVNARPEAEISWWHNGNQLKEKGMRYRLKMALLSKGKYFCLAKNKFGSAVRDFSIASKECVLHAEKDFGSDRPMIVTKHLDRASFETIDGYIHIPKNNTVVLACPSEFKVFNINEIQAICLEGTIFTVNASNYDFSDFKCEETFEPLVLDTNERCLNEEQLIYKIGYEADGNFFEVFEVCFDDYRKRPSYAKYMIDPAMAGTSFEDETWYESESIPIDFDEMYDCKNQNRWISGLLRQPFNDKCCFSRRQLVSARDMLPGLPQIATYSNLNVFPHWSTCKAKNWDLVELLIRRLVRDSNYPLTVWTGISKTLQLQGAKHKEHITITDSKREDKIRVPEYVWKVVQDPRKRASLAIVQVNIPDLKQSRALHYVLCKDICSDIPWIKRSSWRNVEHGLVYCCSIEEFKKSFRLYDVFEPNMEKVLV